MKIQFQEGLIRVRVDEAELAELLAGGDLALTVASTQSVFSLRLRLAECLALRPGETWQLELPANDVKSFVATLPCRDALAFPMPGGAQPLRVDFEVDVRESRKLRGRSRR